MDDGADVELAAWLENRTTFEPPASFVEQANVTDPDIYEAFEENWPDCWERAADLLDWRRQWDTVLDDSDAPQYEWFADGQLNAAENCIDRHVEAGRKNQAAIRWVGKRGETETYTYGDLKRETEAFAAALRDLGVGEDDLVTLYLPMIPELPIAMLACARIGAPHSVVFAGFSANALETRMRNAEASYLVTCDGYYRRGDALNHKGKADRAVRNLDWDVETVVVDRLGGGLPHSLGDGQYDYGTLVDDYWGESVEPVVRDAEDDLFVMYTSGTTGEPKAVRHTTGGYLAQAAWTSHAVLDIKPDDTYWCSADIGWITGHSYIVYGPLALGSTTVIYEETPDYPEKSRIWELIERYEVSVFYTAPTAIRAFMKWGKEHPDEHDLSSLRLLGTVGESINPKAWKWYYEHIGNESCPIVDTWWQTETGGMMITTLPGVSTMKPGSAGQPLPGIDAKVVGEDGEKVDPGEAGYLVVDRPWPGMLRGLAGSDERFVDEYWQPFSDPDDGEWVYFSGDSAKVDEDGYITLLGRVDDVIPLGDFRIGAMEIESAIVGVKGIAEAAVVTTGSELLAYVSTERGYTGDAVLRRRVVDAVEDDIGEVAVPDHVVFAPELPKTRSGKIMRRLLEDIATGEELGDISALRNPETVGELRARLAGETRSYLESEN
ncbi:acyl-CoA synthetase [Natronomonas pharaonis DSM 2160]|uniref:Acetate--CoA ligase n=1 Tax=Natronomonas pharaonis (strain ATCC 35678 / DSM 2160 / CIP 103997 / JCM 8858 / NBRC 14720 / NCIMB 2260 / Gabara) TaxID=348780 RepID=A0A1U7EZC7_NATPD|nr:acetate--CoA ligase [Natronomonas pharaonis]CAI50655.1 acyl-CoA synthetase [Natronomonas pharaonis DSM 2160]